MAWGRICTVEDIRVPRCLYVLATMAVPFLLVIKNAPALFFTYTVMWLIHPLSSQPPQIKWLLKIGCCIPHLFHPTVVSPLPPSFRAGTALPPLPPPSHEAPLPNTPLKLKGGLYIFLLLDPYCPASPPFWKVWMRPMLKEASVAMPIATFPYPLPKWCPLMPFSTPQFSPQQTPWILYPGFEFGFMLGKP